MSELIDRPLDESEKASLQQELGTSDVRELVAMVRSLEAQLVDLYREKEEQEKGATQ